MAQNTEPILVQFGNFKKRKVKVNKSNNGEDNLRTSLKTE